MATGGLDSGSIAFALAGSLDQARPTDHFIRRSWHVGFFFLPASVLFIFGGPAKETHRGGPHAWAVNQGTSTGTCYQRKRTRASAPARIFVRVLVKQGFNAGVCFQVGGFGPQP